MSEIVLKERFLGAVVRRLQDGQLKVLGRFRIVASLHVLDAFVVERRRLFSRQVLGLADNHGHFVCVTALEGGRQIAPLITLDFGRCCRLDRCRRR